MATVTEIGTCYANSPRGPLRTTFERKEMYGASQITALIGGLRLNAPAIFVEELYMRDEIREDGFAQTKTAEYPIISEFDEQDQNAIFTNLFLNRRALNVEGEFDMYGRFQILWLVIQ